MLYRVSKLDELLSLTKVLENCDSQRQSQILFSLQSDQPELALLLKNQILTVDRVLKWEASVLAEIIPHLSEKILAAVLVSRSPVYVGKILSVLDRTKRLKLEDALRQSLSDSQRSAAEIVFIQKVRELERRGLISLQFLTPPSAHRPAS